MDFRLTADQTALLSALDGLVKRFESVRSGFHEFALFSADLEQDLSDGQYFDIAAVPELGAVSAVLAVERLARLPCTAEFALSMLVRPHLAREWPRPLAVCENGQPGRFVAMAKTLLLVRGKRIELATPASAALAASDSLFAYPMGRLTGAVHGEPLSDDEAAAVRSWLRVALAAEAAGLMHSAIATTVEHLTTRRQFGRPIGTFQALRHRLAECSVLAGGVRWLALKAGATGDAGDAALAALHAQQSATRIVYDVHQMHGAMGMTLEHSLHLWTYRLKALLSQLGGRSAQASAAADYVFATSSAARSNS